MSSRNTQTSEGGRDRPEFTGFSMAVGLSLLCLFAALLFPGHPKGFSADLLSRLPLEFPILVLILLWVTLPAARWICLGLVLAIGTLLLLRLADVGSYLAFNRRFSPLLELHLVADGWNLASTSIGPVEAALVVAAALIVLAILIFILYRCLMTIARLTGRIRKQLTWISSIALLIGAAGIGAEYHFNYNGPVEAKILPEFSWRITNVRNSIKDQKKFITELGVDNVLDDRSPTFKQLAGRDVIFLFVESYGRGYLDAERFSASAQQRLQSVEDTINNAGLLASSGWLTSPIRGGRSWLAHATFASGLEIDNQARFDRLITTERRPISHLFRDAGWQSVGLMPAIQFAWPEGVWYGFEDLRESADMGFAGERFGYVTMPDQYILSFLENSIRRKYDEPIVATAALLSTHAPWTPLPKKLDWDLINDGAIYDGSNRFGEPISWKYRSKVQDMYTQSFDYTLDVIGEFAAKYADDAVIVVLGDHQPPPIINGWGASADVPVHIITNDQSLLDQLPADNWISGMLPDDSVEPQPMANMRSLLSTVFE